MAITHLVQTIEINRKIVHSGVSCLDIRPTETRVGDEDHVTTWRWRDFNAKN